MNPELSDTAWNLFDKGINTFPLSYRSKKPPKGFAWKELTQRRVTEEEIREWFCCDTKTNIALLCGQVSGVAAIDADSLPAARALFRVLPYTPAMEKTASGVHFILRLPEGLILPPAVKTTIKGIRCDIRGEASYIAMSPSLHPTGKRYEWVNWPWDLEDVPAFDPEWLQEMQQSVREPHRLTRGQVRNVDAYLSRIESIQGQAGSRGLIRACAVCRDAGLTETEAMGKLMLWNSGPTVNPSWSTEELARAVTRTYAKTHV
jgi:hypothetical protein